MNVICNRRYSFNSPVWSVLMTSNMMIDDLRSGIQPLLPDDFGDEALAGIKFGEEFGNRYGQPRPQFFPGSLDDALTDVNNCGFGCLVYGLICQACNKPVAERKMLAIYLHHDSSVLTNVFCTQVRVSNSHLQALLKCV